jgi:hypothetical protein
MLKDLLGPSGLAKTGQGLLCPAGFVRTALGVKSAWCRLLLNRRLLLFQGR